MQPSESEVPTPPSGYCQYFYGDFPDLLIGDIVQFLFNEHLTDCPGFCRSIILKIFHQRHQCVGMATIQYLATFAQAHEPVAGPALPVTGCAKARDIAQLDKPSDYLIQCPSVTYVKLLRILIFLLRLTIASNTGP